MATTGVLKRPGACDTEAGLPERKPMSVNDTAEVETVEPSNELPTEQIAVADTGAGLLVFEVETEYRSHLNREAEVGRELIGFADVSDWSAVAEALRSRGLGVGATTNLPEYSADQL